MRPCRSKRPITIRDLLTHTAGISYGDGPARDEYTAAGIHGWFLADKAMPVGDVIKKLATLPFDAQPGERFIYGYNTDILGYLVESRLGDEPGRFHRQEDHRRRWAWSIPISSFPRTSSAVSPRFTASTKRAGSSSSKIARDNFYVKGPRMCYAGGAGLLVTAEDYARFLLMLLNGGELDGVRILSPKSVELMTVDHVGDLTAPGLRPWASG